MSKTFMAGDILQRGRVRYVLSNGGAESVHWTAWMYGRSLFSGRWKIIDCNYILRMHIVHPHMLVHDGWTHIPGPNHPAEAGTSIVKCNVNGIDCGTITVTGSERSGA